MQSKDILHFWFKECSPKDWFQKSDAFDAMLVDRFKEIHHQASQGECADWRETAEGRLAEIIVLDQFSRNIFRDSPKAFQHDIMALTLSQEMIRNKEDQGLSDQYRVFAYMPFMHSESLKIQQQGVEIFTELGIEVNLKYMIDHKDVIMKFGRFPHRNNILGRKSSKEELEYLAQGGGF